MHSGLRLPLFHRSCHLRGPSGSGWFAVERRGNSLEAVSSKGVENLISRMHPPLSLHKHPMCAEIIELFQKCHTDHPYRKFLGQCTDLKIQLDRCFRQEKAVKRKANFEESKRFKERLDTFRKEQA